MSSSEKKKNGSVTVVGGGISGMQSALDLAEAGLKVQLVEEKTAIGGTMSRLDKTFPTNDCAMCIVSPKLVDVGRHLNIDIHPGAKVKSIEGEEGNFKVNLHKKARYVDIDKCTGCGECTSVCPVELPSEFDGDLGNRKAIYKLYAQAMPSAYAIEKKGLSPCKAACPAGVNVQGYVQLTKVGKYMEAWRLIYEDNPLPAVCGRVCTHPCEAGCHRRELDEPVNIRELKRFVADKCYTNPDELSLPEKQEGKKEKIAVIGSGPAGLSAAYQLSRKGYSVTVLEKMNAAGGMLRTGIPEYRLPKDVLDLEIGLLEKQGIEIKTGVETGSDITLEELRKQYDAVFLATGAHKGIYLNLPGEDLKGVHSGVDFLRHVNLGEKVEPGRRIAVIGGGNTAMDTARTALRLGAGEVTIVYRRSEAEITADAEEIKQAREEGIKFQMMTGPQKIVEENGAVSGLECILNELGEPDESGRRKPVPVEGSEFVLDVDTVLVAVGQKPEVIDENLDTDRGKIIVSENGYATGISGVFAAGDAVTGPATVIDAIGAGKKAAAEIDLYLQGEAVESAANDVKAQRPQADFPAHAAGVEKAGRVNTYEVEAETRTGTFDEVNKGITEEEARNEATRCLNCAVCSECGECVKVCQANAIDHSMQDGDVEIETGAVILNPGGEIYNPSELDYLGYGKYPNVITAIEFERILAASGPYEGHMVRPSDGREPEKIAWIQCVGSRNLRIKHDYCSSVCCMYAIKEAVIAKEHSPHQLDTAIFMMDMRSYGKDFERYYNRASEEHGVRFVRSRIYSVMPSSEEEGSLKIRYAGEDGTVYHEDFDMVVLSTGFEPGCASKELANAAGVELDESGFCKTGEFSRVETTRPGIFAAGVFAGPKDIPETVVEASAGAGYTSRLLAEVRGTQTSVKEYPPEKDVSGEEPRIGVFVCNCGINIGSIVNVSEVVDYVKDLEYVVHAREFLFTCSQDSVEKIKADIEEHNLNRVVVASCTPRTHAPLFQSALREAGLNPYLYEHVNIREHSSWVHKDYPEEATEKAKDLVRMAVARAPVLRPVYPIYTDINRDALVVGGGAAGMTAALSLAEQGFGVFLVEKEKELGGHMRHIQYGLEESSPQEKLQQLIDSVESHPQVEVFTGAEIEDAGGYPGNYRTQIKTEESSSELQHGAVILATGAQQAGTGEYLYGEHSGVVTQSELEQKLSFGGAGDINNVVMIQCVGSRDENRPYCSRICCQQALKNALKLKELNPSANIYILYRDIRSYGLMEKYYTRARQKGVIFVRYDLDEKPSVTGEDGNLRVTVKDHVLEENISIEPDLLVLSTGIEPNKDNQKLSTLYKVPMDADGFLLEAHMKLRPVDFSAEGLYMCGLAHAPKLAGESIVQANAAAMRAATLLSKDKLENVSITATVNKKRCTGCSVCVKVCNYGARELDTATGISTVKEVFCQGCGACVAACPNGATQQKGFEKSQMMAALRAVVK